MAYTEASKRAMLKYKKSGKRARMELNMSKEDGQALKELAEKTGESRTSLIRRLIWQEYNNVFNKKQ